MSAPDDLPASALAQGPTPALDFALARLGPLRGVPVALARPLDPAKAVLAARLRLAGAEVEEGARPAYVLGAETEDLTGHLGATSRALGFAQTIPVIDLSQSPLMGLFHDHIGIGQASVMAVLDITNLQVAGRRVVVCGYGPTGAGVAAHVAALGGRVVVVERDPVRGAGALVAGYGVEGFARALPTADVVFVTDEGPQLTQSAAAHLGSGTILCAAGTQAAIAPEIIASAAHLRPVRAHVEAFDLPHAADLKLVAKGQPLHLAEGQGLPLEACDVVLALHVLGLAQLLAASSPKVETVPLDREVEAALAARVVRQMGGQVGAD